MTFLNIQALARRPSKPVTSSGFALWRIVSCLFITLLSSGNGALVTYGQQPSAEQRSAVSPSLATNPINDYWTWTASGKHSESDLAQCLSLGGNEQLELRFYKHEFGNISVRLQDQSMDLKSHSKSLRDQMTKNQVPVTLAFDDEAPLTEIWAIVQDPDSGMQLLTPRGKYIRIYELVLKSKRFSVSYPDKSGNPVAAVFDVSTTPMQVRAHNEKTHHSGMKDALEIGGAALGPL